MRALVKGGEARGFRYTAPPSKSCTHRAFAIAALAEGRSKVLSPLRARDTEATLRACRALGVEAREHEGYVELLGTGGRLRAVEKTIDVANSGTTLRLFISIAALDGRVVLTGDESIRARPNAPLLQALSQLGVKASSLKGDGRAPIKVEGGGIKGGRARIRGDVSSQFISSLLIASPYASKDVSIELTTPLVSKPYVEVTMEVMSSFGVQVEQERQRLFRVPREHYTAREYEVEGDYSSASYLLALAALTGVEARIDNLPARSKQGDRAILEALASMGAEVEAKRNTVSIRGGELKGIDVSLRDTPDLLPTIAALACGAEGETRIRDIAHARLKECDRISACAEELAKFGAKIKEGRDQLLIKGSTHLKGAKVNSHGDHRMAMALAVLGAAAKGETVIEGAETVAVSFPGFFQALEKAGVEVRLR